MNEQNLSMGPVTFIKRTLGATANVVSTALNVVDGSCAYMNAGLSKALAVQATNYERDLKVAIQEDLAEISARYLAIKDKVNKSVLDEIDAL